MGAQGMNTGCRTPTTWLEAGARCQGERDARAARSYEPERMPVAQRLLRTTDRAFMLVVKETWLAGALPHADPRAHRGVRDASIERAATFLRTISQIGIRYPDSPLSRTLGGLPEGAPRAGDRFPWLRVRLSERRSGRGPVREARRHALQPDRGRTSRPSP
jgi:2-polyprenyl-6-methoxyphenol hydroxylase-like FAD-dependent oxidoreductase